MVGVGEGLNSTMSSPPERKQRAGTPWDFAVGGPGLADAIGDDKPFLKHPTNLPKTLKPTIDL